MIELVKDVVFTGKKYQATVILGRKRIKVTHNPVCGEIMDDIHKQMIANAKLEIIKEHCK